MPTARDRGTNLLPLESVEKAAGTREDDQQLRTVMSSYLALEERIPADRPLCRVRRPVDIVFGGDFDRLCAKVGRPSTGGHCCRGCSIRCELNLLFPWFVGLEIEEEVRNAGLMSNEHFTVDGTLIEARAGQKRRVKGEFCRSPERPSRDPRHFMYTCVTGSPWQGRHGFRLESYGRNAARPRGTTKSSAPCLRSSQS